MVHLSACVFRLLVELASTELAALRFRDTEAIGRIDSIETKTHYATA